MSAGPKADDAHRASLKQKMQIVVGIITISDRASAGEYKDLGGPALKEAAQKAGWQVLSEAIVSENDSLIFSTRLRLDFDYRRDRSRPARCHAGSSSRHHARRVARLWRSNARRIDEDYAQLNLIAQPGSDCRSLPRDRASRKTERCRGMSQLRARRNCARSGARTARAHFVLMRPRQT